MMSSVSSVNSFVLGLMIGLMVMLHANPRVINATLPKVEGTFLSLSILKQQTFACGWVGTWQCVHFALCIQVLCLGSLRCSFQKKVPREQTRTLLTLARKPMLPTQHWSRPSNHHETSWKISTSRSVSGWHSSAGSGVVMVKLSSMIVMSVSANEV